MSIELPKTIKIGYRNYEIVPLSSPDLEMTDKYGWCDKLNARIYIYVSDQPMITADTLLHEVIHATWTWMGLEERHDEESVATRLGTGLINVFYDNPDLLEFLFDCVNDGEEEDEEDNNHKEFKLT